MRKGMQAGPSAPRMMLALFVLGVLAVLVREMPGMRRHRKAHTM